ncbi:ribonuclease P [Candidatus Woesearchaeota archaeon]|nr:MAG: ribonuclease P [Candidatus Woesearchaeota archaeon]
MARSYRKKPKFQTSLAKERIKELFMQAEKVWAEEPELSHRYVELARKISMKYKVKIPQSLKRKFCKKCHHFLFPGDNCRVRFRDKKIVITCFDCKNIMRYPHKK